jgi:DNA-directed RNA polymerase subunit RPC12/RpoP
MRSAKVTAAEDTYRCAGCGARWSYEAVRYVALCPACASGLVRVSDPERSESRERPSRSGQRWPLVR